MFIIILLLEERFNMHKNNRKYKRLASLIASALLFSGGELLDLSGMAEATEAPQTAN